MEVYQSEVWVYMYGRYSGSLWEIPDTSITTLKMLNDSFNFS